MAAALLLFLLALAEAAFRRGALCSPPPPSNVRYSIDVRRCQLNVTWSPPEAPIDDNCTLSYCSVVRTDGKENNRIYEVSPSRIEKVDLGKDIVFGVRTECYTSRGLLKGDWLNITLPQQGLPGTGAVDIRCVWHNEKYITCSWKPGANAAQHSYDLFYWYNDQMEIRRCTNSSHEGKNFRCTFDYAKPQGTSILSILVEGHSEDIRPVCLNGKNFPGKMHPPSIVNISKDSNGVRLQWTKPADRNNLHYEVEIKDTKTNSVRNETCDDQTSRSIGLEPNTRHAFRVRVIPKVNGIWSDWSEVAFWGDPENNTFYILLYIFIPFCVAVLTLILLVYLKRIKLLILPKIPDPGQVLKKMFEEQSEDLQKQPTYDPVKDEQIHSLTLMEPAGHEV